MMPSGVTTSPSRGARGARTTAATALAAGLGMAAAAIGVLAAQVVETRRRIGPRRTVPPYHDGRYGRGTGTSIRVAVLGDSGAAGLGADYPGDAMGAIIAGGVAQATRRAVVLTNHAVVGARTADLDPQITRALTAPPHVAVVMVGANDVTHAVPVAVSRRRLEAAVRRLRVAGVQVVVGTCPDLGTVRPIPQPLRWVARRWSRRLAAAQAVATVAGGGRAVSLGDLLGPEFDARPDVMFSADRFHPSSDGYRAAAEALLPSVVAALRLGPQGDLLPELYRPGEVHTVEDAAAIAAAAAGTEVSPLGQRLGGAWARARRRARLPLGDSTVSGH
jgi:lysophospholipase L1-like esterase